MTTGKVWTSRRVLVFASLAMLAIKEIVPFGRFLLYPFTLLATWVHEMGHGLAALCVGGSFSALEIFSDASGLAHTAERAGFPSGVVAAAGLLAPPIVGAGVLALSRGPRRARVVLLVLAAALTASLAIWVRSMAGFIAIPIALALMVYAAVKLEGNRRTLFAQFVGLTLGLDTISRLDYLFTRSVIIDGVPHPSDIALVATAWGGPDLLWGLLLAAVSLAFVGLGLGAAWRRYDGRSAPPAEKAKAKSSAAASA